MNPFRLLRERRFGPFFWTQFLGAFNDNVYKNALIILIAYELGSAAGSEGHVMINAAAGLFILPFLLFSATAGQIADKYDKAWLMRRIKLAEIAIMLLAAVALMMKSAYALIGLLFLMGAQSSLFGPVKYAILPQHLHRDELVGGNGLVGMGTFLAILFGTLLGGLLIAVDGQGPAWVALTVVVLALAGWLASRGIPVARPADPHLQIRWNIVTSSLANVRHLLGERIQLLTAVAISWFWFFGATLLTQIPNFTRLDLYADERVVTALLTAFSLGIGVGSLLVERLSRRRIVPRVALLGGAGMTGFGLLLPLLVMNVPPPEAAAALRGFGAFWSHGGGIILAGVIGLGISGGLYIVPLFALIQRRAPEASRSRVIAGVNILNALFMVVSAVVAGALLGSGWQIPQLFALVAVLNLLLVGVVGWQLRRVLGHLGAIDESAERATSSGADAAS